MATHPSSEYFTLHRLAEGVFAAVAKVNSPAFSNAGIVDTGDFTLIFDAFNSIHAAADLRQAAVDLTGRGGDYVIISHAHDDHWVGAQVFADHAAILATRKTCENMEVIAADLADLQRNPAEYGSYLEDIEARLEAADDPGLRAHLTWAVAIERHQFANLASLKPAIPNQIFDKRIDFHGSRRAATLYSPGAGHTASDAVLALPDDSIAFIGDLGFFHTHPYLGDSTPEKWLATLEAFLASDIDTFIPGHGPVGRRDDLKALQAYIRALDEMAAAVVASGGTQEQAARQAMPAFSQDWAGFGRFERSMRFLYRSRAGILD